MGYEKPELSKKNKYWIPKERYYELLHFCRQYLDFKHELLELYSTYPVQEYDDSEHPVDCRPVENITTRAIALERKIGIINDCAMAADPDLASWIIKGVTHGYSYGYLAMKLGMPAGKDMYYDRYRKFFYLLAQKH